MEAAPGFEPGIKALQAHALPLGYAATIMVPGAGLEPAQCYHRGILSPLRLPISPSGQQNKKIPQLKYRNQYFNWGVLERETRFELATPTLARLCSTTELFPHCFVDWKYSKKIIACKEFLEKIFV